MCLISAGLRRVVELGFSFVERVKRARKNRDRAGKGSCDVSGS